MKHYYKVILNNYTTRYLLSPSTYKPQTFHEIDYRDLKICKSGFHFCKYLIECQQHMNFINNIDNYRYILIEPGEHIIKGDGKYCSNSLTVVEEIPKNKIMEIIKSEWRSALQENGHVILFYPKNEIKKDEKLYKELCEIALNQNSNVMVHINKLYITEKMCEIVSNSKYGKYFIPEKFNYLFK